MAERKRFSHKSHFEDTDDPVLMIPFDFERNVCIVDSFINALYNNKLLFVTYMGPTEKNHVSIHTYEIVVHTRAIQKHV